MPVETCLNMAVNHLAGHIHAKSCHDSTSQTYMNKQASNMAAYLLKQSQKLVTATARIFWHSVWHIFWHSFWHVLWHSIWHIFFFIAGAVRAQGMDDLKLLENRWMLQKGNTIECRKQGFAQLARTSLLTTQKCTTLKQKQRITWMTMSFRNKAVKPKTAKQRVKLSTAPQRNSNVPKVKSSPQTAARWTWKQPFFFAGGCLGWSRAERPSVSWAVV